MKVISNKLAVSFFLVVILLVLIDLSKLVVSNYVLEICFLLLFIRFEKCYFLESRGIYGGYFLNGIVIYVDIVKVFKEDFEN